jgi:hypothetical protein
VSRKATVVRVREAALPEPQVLKFDFAQARKASPARAPARRAPSTIKDAIIRWLDEQL